MMDPRIPAILHPLLEEYTRRLDQEMPGRITALYLEGALALDGFNPRLSDIDFIAALCSQPATGDFEKIAAIHQGIEKQYPQWKMSGMFFQAGDLGFVDRPGAPFLNYHDGKLHWSERFGLSSVTWWILQKHGIAVFGPPPQTLPYTVDMEHLLQTQRENLNTYWASWTTRPVRILALLSDWGVQWTVLGVLRQFYTLRERKITSKVQAGAYGLEQLPDRWHPIIREAIALRETPKQTHYRSRLKRAADAYGLIKVVIQTCSALP